MKIRFLLVLMTICFVFTGCFGNIQNYDDETIQKAKKAVESYIRNNYDDIKTIEFDDNDYASPMGGLMIDGKVNGSFKFSAGVDEETFEIGSFGN
ncbi:DUF1433 domain-containing protein [Virgibacillus sp. 179-BFC.A HS]|uniref:DUF1433 domain-containing protein n=1 Tax=Tigheibacillus jepli TaxID=3035914 RepID=A0ABU5CEX0_9BACI|nr:DUF1433 domain-containing protein [Virgibacillus sp. 179-BFC.A HS]MDY0404065.1 DUF1433 domain-containing protein [Virgibacillus sp. 179-BFC.A HS]